MAANTLAKKLTIPVRLEDRIKFCKAWQKTTLSKSEFIRQHNLPSTFHTWCNKLLGGTKSANAQQISAATQPDESWAQIIPNNVSSNYRPSLQSGAPQAPTEFKLICNDINFSFCMPIEQIVNFIKGLCHATTAIR
jgi:hypothetical protein